MVPFKKLLVTGHLGFIGSAFCTLFRDRYRITGVDFRGWGSMESNLVPGVTDLCADIADEERMHAVFETAAPDAIVNFAAESHVDRSNDDDSCFWRSNVMGARVLALEAARRGIRMVHVSTDEVYGDARDSTAPWTEASPLQPKNLYSVTKAAAEMLLSVYGSSERHRLDIVITRGANTIGPRQFPEKAVPKAIWCFSRNIDFPLFRTPAKRMWMYVDDHAAGIEAALRLGRTGEVYNIAPSFSSEAMTSDVIGKVRELVGRGTINEVTDRANYDLRYWMDPLKAARELGWQARYELKETIEATVAWYRENDEWLKRANDQLAESTPR